MTKTIFALMFATLFATFVFAQAEEPDWQDVMTHRLESEGSTFPKEASDAVLKAILNGWQPPEDGSIIVTNFVEFCDDKRCFAAALYMVDPTAYSMDEMQYLVWLERISDVRFEYCKIWEYRTGVSVGWGSLSVVDPSKLSGVTTTACLLVKTAEVNAFHSVQMKLFCRGHSDYPEILWEYNGDYCHESLAQAFRRSIVTFKDIDNDHINDIVLDSVEGWQSGWEQGDSTFEITKHRILFYYSSNGKFLGVGLIPDLTK